MGISVPDSFWFNIAIIHDLYKIHYENPKFLELYRKFKILSSGLCYRISTIKITGLTEEEKHEKSNIVIAVADFTNDQLIKKQNQIAQKIKLIFK